MGIAETIALTLGVGWASGLNLYATVFMLGLLQTTGAAQLPADLAVCGEPWVMVAAGLMYCVEFFADKIPGVDNLWDVAHTFLRIPAGAVLAAGASMELGAGAQVAAALVGGTLAAGTHATKAGTRAAINVSPEPFSNWTASVGEDLAVIGGLWAALFHPWLFVLLLVAFVLGAIWLMPRIWRGLQRIAGRLRARSGDAASDAP
ncbi:MAG: DUF4126 domain-containing protein [Myxococcota bacterium]